MWCGSLLKHLSVLTSGMPTEWNKHVYGSISKKCIGYGQFTEHQIHGEIMLRFPHIKIYNLWNILYLCKYHRGGHASFNCMHAQGNNVATQALYLAVTVLLFCITHHPSHHTRMVRLLFSGLQAVAPRFVPASFPVVFIGWCPFLIILCTKRLRWYYIWYFNVAYILDKQPLVIARTKTQIYLHRSILCIGFV